MASKGLFTSIAASAIFVGGIWSAVVSNAQAQWYVSANAGGTILMDSVKTGTLAGFSATGDLDFDPGFGVTGAAGYAWGGLRLEGEVSYRENDLNDWSVASYTFGGVTTPTASTFNLGGTFSALGFMANAWYDFDTGSKWVPFIGGGAGAAHMNYKITSVSIGGVGSVTNYNDSNTVLAYQAGAGIGYKVNANSTVTLSYRLFKTFSNPKFNDAGEGIEVEYMSHNIMAGAVMKF